MELVVAALAKYGVTAAWEIAWGFFKEHWRPILFGTGIASAAIMFAWQRHVISDQAKTIAVSADVIEDTTNALATSNQTAEDLRRAALESAAAAAASIEKAHEVAATHDAVKKEQRNEQGSSDLAGPYVDDLNDRLRALDANDHPDPH